MNKPEDIVYSSEALDLARAAAAFTQLLENPESYRLKDYVGKLHLLLPELYFRIAALPGLSPDFEDLNQRFVTEEDYEMVRSRLLSKFGEYDSYEEVFSPNRLEEDEAISESIAENLTDIYQDIKDFTLLFDIGTNEVMYEALWELRQSFENFWGQKLANTLRAIHLLHFSEKEIEENQSNPEENTNFNINTSNWIISRRQEDMRDE